MGMTGRMWGGVIYTKYQEKEHSGDISVHWRIMLRDQESANVDQIKLAHNRSQWPTLFNTAMDLLVL
jgi:hypothetical protein